MIRDNISSNDTIDTNKVAKAILQYRNTPLHGCNLSPAQILFHRQLRNSIPRKPSHYKLHSDWLTAAKYREDEFQQRNQIIVEQYNMNRNAKQLPALEVGTHVNMQGKDKRWVKTGNIVERLPHRQYRIKLGGSVLDGSSENASGLHHHIRVSMTTISWMATSIPLHMPHLPMKFQKQRFQLSRFDRDSPGLSIVVPLSRLPHICPGTEEFPLKVTWCIFSNLNHNFIKFSY